MSTHSREITRLAMTAKLSPDAARRQIRKALADSEGAEGGQARAAAAKLGVSYETLHRVAKALGMIAELPRKGQGAGRPANKDSEPKVAKAG